MLWGLREVADTATLHSPETWGEQIDEDESAINIQNVPSWCGPHPCNVVCDRAPSFIYGVRLRASSGKALSSPSLGTGVPTRITWATPGTGESYFHTCFLWSYCSGSSLCIVEPSQAKAAVASGNLRAPDCHPHLFFADPGETNHSWKKDCQLLHIPGSPGRHRGGACRRSRVSGNWQYQALAGTVSELFRLRLGGSV